MLVNLLLHDFKIFEQIIGQSNLRELKWKEADVVKHTARNTETMKNNKAGEKCV